MSDLTLPTLDELARMSVDFDFDYPESYTRFVRAAQVPTFVKPRSSPRLVREVEGRFGGDPG